MININRLIVSRNAQCKILTGKQLIINDAFSFFKLIIQGFHKLNEISNIGISALLHKNKKYQLQSITSSED